MINYNEIFLNTLEYLKNQKMSLIPNTLFNEDDVMELKTVNEKGEMFKIIIDFVNHYARIEKILEETREVDCLDFEIFKMNRNMIREDEIISGLKCFLLNPRNDMDKTTIDACRGAIELLEQEPCEDAVSRQAVLYALDKRFDSIPMEQTTEILLLRKDLRELPPVTYYKVESEDD